MAPIKDLKQWSLNFLAPGTNFSRDWVGAGTVLDDLRALHLLCILFLCHISSTSDHQALIRPWRLETADLKDTVLLLPILSH